MSGTGQMIVTPRSSNRHMLSLRSAKGHGSEKLLSPLPKNSSESERSNVAEQEDSRKLFPRGRFELLREEEEGWRDEGERKNVIATFR